MAGKIKRMSQVKQLLLLYKQGKAKKTIARALGMSKNTVKTYLYKIDGGKFSIDELLKMEDPKLEATLFSGNPSFKDERYEHLKNQLDYYTSELNKTGVTRGLLWREYQQTTTNAYSYTQFCHHLNQHNKSRKPSLNLDHKAGEKLFVDFAGKTLSYIDRETGNRIECQVFVACLPYSDYGFAMAVPSQKMEDFIHAMVCCLNFFGGAPKTIVPDNLKSAIVKANNYEPTINQALDDLAVHYKTTVTPTRPAKPKDKALVENQVKLIYIRAYAPLRNRKFFDLASLNEAIMEQVKLHNQTRMQQKNYCREEKFLADEKTRLTALPEKSFEIKYYKTLKANTNNHVYITADKHYYSVPYVYIGQKVAVIYTRSLVKIYNKKGDVIAVHARSKIPGRYSTQSDHLCSQHQHYISRSPEYYLEKAKRMNPTLYRLIDLVFKQDRYPEQLYKTCDGLLSLSRKTDPELFRHACETAISFEKYSYMFIKNIIEKNPYQYTEKEEISKPLPTHKNTRGADYYE
ncbi:MAG TPA: IS21 family transposase [Salinivirga sp.]|uniref:IS21 family transposase n=1 Tax=Salinivirga sp. TaxID=1970192 RepID=UPI002B4712A4|nr:IS21 family transposase [Salinivirga sp.]HKK59250.1 IS21 family transposase [Salinivirga sp.]